MGGGSGLDVGSDLSGEAESLPTMERVRAMNDRIWTKVGQMDQAFKDNAAVMQSDLARLKAENRLSVAPSAVAETGLELSKEQFYELSTRLDNLQDSHEATQAQVLKQQELAHTLLEAQECSERETKEDFQALHSELSSNLQQQKVELQERVLADSEQTQQALEKLRANLLQQMAEFVTELRSDLQAQMLKAVSSECQAFQEPFLQLQQLASQNDLEPRLLKCEVFAEEEGPKIDQAMSTINELRLQLGECLSKIGQTEVSLNKVSGQQAQVQEECLLSSENAFKELEKRIEEAMEVDHLENLKSTTAINKEVGALHETEGLLRQKMGDSDVRGEQMRQQLEELKRKSEQGERLLQETLSMVEKALPNLVGRTDMLENSVGDMRSGLEALTLRGMEVRTDMQRLQSELSEGLREERSHARQECAAAMERSVFEVQPRLDSLDSWRGAVEQHQAASNERCAAQEQRYSLQDQRLTSHDDMLHRLATRCQEIPRMLEARVDEARAAAKEDLTATTLTAFQGEMALMAKIAQLSNQKACAPQPGLVFDGQNWRQQLQPGQVQGQLMFPTS